MLTILATLLVVCIIVGMYFVWGSDFVQNAVATSLGVAASFLIAKVVRPVARLHVSVERLSIDDHPVVNTFDSNEITYKITVKSGFWKGVYEDDWKSGMSPVLQFSGVQLTKVLPYENDFTMFYIPLFIFGGNKVSVDVQWLKENTEAIFFVTAKLPCSSNRIAVDMFKGLSRDVVVTTGGIIRMNSNKNGFNNALAKYKKSNNATKSADASEKNFKGTKSADNAMNIEQSKTTGDAK